MKKLSQEYVEKYYLNEKYIMNSTYKNSHNKDKLTCPVGHIIEISFSNFQTGRRCAKCSNKEKLSYEYVYNYYKEHNYIMKSIYKTCMDKDELICPKGHKINMTFDSFKTKNSRCKICNYNQNKHSHEYVYDYYANEQYMMHNIYNGGDNKDNLTCPVGHEIEITFDSFKQGRRCKKCFHINNSGQNNWRYNINREELPLNSRLRLSRTKKWVTKYMKTDPNYNNFLENSEDYVIDHIIPIKLFCELFTKYNLDENLVKKIVNRRDNIQLLTFDDNRIKWYKGSSLFEATNYLINNGIPFETFLETKVNI